MGFNNSDRRADVTAEPSPGSPRVLPRRARALIEGVLGYLGDLAQGLASLTDLARWGLERLDGSAPPAAAQAVVDLGAVLRAEQLAERVARLEARHPARVVERRRAPFPCSVCGFATVEVLEGVVPSGDSLPALCAGCGQPWYAHKTAEVIP